MEKRDRSRIIAMALFLNVFLTACGMEEKQESEVEAKPTSYYSDYTTKRDYAASLSELTTRAFWEETTIASTTEPTTRQETTTTTEPSQPHTNRSDDAENVIVVDGNELTELENQLYTKKFSINSGDFNSFLNEIGKNYIAYDYEEYFNINDNTSLSYTPSVRAGTIIKNGQVDANKLSQYVLKNNAGYLNAHGQGNYGSTTSSLVTGICQDMAKEINYFIAKADIDLDLLEEKLQTLKVFTYSGYGKGVYIAGEGIMQINVENVNNKETICHETVHFIQAASQREISTNKYINRLGYCYQTSENRINPYNYLWLEEGSAESLGTVAYLKESKPSIYQNWYDAINGLKMASFDDGFNIELTTLQKDINVLYKYFGAQQPNAKSNVQKMLYTTNIMNDTTSDNESAIFYNSLGSNNFKFDYYKQKDVYSSYNCSIAATKAQIFYSKLAQKIVGKSVNLNEVFSVIASFEDKNNNSIYYTSDKNGVDNYLGEYCAMQQGFFEVLGKQLGVSTESIITMYDCYYNSVRQYSEVGWLSSSENGLFKRQYSSNRKTARQVFSQKEGVSYSR